MRGVPVSSHCRLGAATAGPVAARRTRRATSAGDQPARSAWWRRPTTSASGSTVGPGGQPMDRRWARASCRRRGTPGRRPLVEPRRRGCGRHRAGNRDRPGGGAARARRVGWRRRWREARPVVDDDRPRGAGDRGAARDSAAYIRAQRVRLLEVRDDDGRRGIGGRRSGPPPRRPRGPNGCPAPTPPADGDDPSAGRRHAMSLDHASVDGSSAGRPTAIPRKRSGIGAVRTVDGGSASARGDGRGAAPGDRRVGSSVSSAGRRRCQLRGVGLAARQRPATVRRSTSRRDADADGRDGGDDRDVGPRTAAARIDSSTCPVTTKRRRARTAKRSSSPSKSSWPGADRTDGPQGRILGRVLSASSTSSVALAGVDVAEHGRPSHRPPRTAQAIRARRGWLRWAKGSPSGRRRLRRPAAAPARAHSTRRPRSDRSGEAAVGGGAPSIVRGALSVRAHRAG